MPAYINNSTRGPSIIRAVDAGTYTITLNDLRSNATTELVTNATIKRVSWSTSGSITVARGAVTALSLHQSGEMRFDEFGGAITSNNTGTIVVTIATGGTIFLEVSKEATYNVDPYTGQTI
jgi:hypothetical protein